MKCNTDIDASNVVFGRTNHFSSGTALALVRIQVISFPTLSHVSTTKSQKMVEMAENELA